MVSISSATPLESQVFHDYLSHFNCNGRSSIPYSEDGNDFHAMTLSSDISESDLSDLSDPSEQGYILNLDSGQQIRHQVGFHGTYLEETSFSDDESVILDFEDLEFLDNCDAQTCWQHQNNENFTQHWETESGHQLRRQGLPCFDELTRPLRTDDTMSREQEISYNLHLIEEDENVMCRKGKRGAKHILLWKFLLEKLRDSPDLVRWTDRESGIFRFVDTIEISRQWGTKKGKRDMTFEKLSRAIRHYYKSGFMSRQEGTRLVYRINWKMVPKAYRL